MITTYLLKNCQHCKGLLEYLKQNPNVNVCLIMISKEEIPYVKYQEPRIKEFPVAFSGSPKVNGMPHKNSKMMAGSNNILQSLKTHFGNKHSKDVLTGSNIDINYQYNNEGNISNLNNIRRHRNNCFGRTCHVMDRPFGPTDNQFILQGYQPECAVPLRSDLPIRPSSNRGNRGNLGTRGTRGNMNNFGMTTPGTNAWKAERQVWPCPRILIDDSNCEQNLKGNTMARLNYPSTYSNDYINRMVFDVTKETGNNASNTSNFGRQKTKALKEFSKKYAQKYGQKYAQKYLNRFISGPVNSTKPFLTYAAGGNGVSRVTGNNYLREQIPIERQRKDAFISGNIQNYADRNADTQSMLFNGLNSQWSINAQGINPRSNRYGKRSNTRTTMTKSVKGTPEMIKPVRRVPIPGAPKIALKEINQKPYSVANKGRMVQTTFSAGMGKSGVASPFYKFPNNGNVFGKVKSCKTSKSDKKEKKEKTVKTGKSKMGNNKVKFTSPLGIEISF
jgi:hypothetical protein